MRHLDQATSAAIHKETAENIDETVAAQVESHPEEPVDAILREVVAEARRWADRMELSLPEHRARAAREADHEDLLELVPPPSCPQAAVDGPGSLLCTACAVGFGR